MSDLNSHPLIRRYIEANRFGEFLGMEFFIVKPGIINYSMRVSIDHLATPVSMHGGAIAALMDAVVGVGALSLVCADDRVVSTVEMKISFLRPVVLDDLLTGTSEVLKAGKRIIFMEGRLVNQKQELIAIASATMNAYPKEKAGY
jgi:uncharacterized protein (TIGR00369 family)